MGARALSSPGPACRSLSLGGRGCGQTRALLGLQTSRAELIFSGHESRLHMGVRSVQGSTFRPHAWFNVLLSLSETLNF